MAYSSSLTDKEWGMMGERKILGDMGQIIGDNKVIHPKTLEIWQMQVQCNALYSEIKVNLSTQYYCFAIAFFREYIFAGK